MGIHTVCTLRLRKQMATQGVRYTINDLHIQRLILLGRLTQVLNKQYLPDHHGQNRSPLQNHHLIHW